MHVVRRGYGWTDAQIIEHVETWGSDGLFACYKHIVEDRATEWRWMVNAAQAARTPMDKKSGQGLQGYVRKLHKAIDSMVPWVGSAKIERLKKLRGTPDKKALEETEAMMKKLNQ
jgi:hypothetical protein